MDYFGFSIWTPLFMGSADWSSSLELGGPDDFDPEGDSWKGIFNGLAKVLKESDVSREMGGCLHISSDIARMCADTRLFNILGRYKEAAGAFKKKIPFELGVHCLFGKEENPLGSLYSTTFLSDISNAEALGATTLVAHPPYNPSYNHADYIKMLVDEVTRDELLDALEQRSTIIAWENMIEGQFSNLKELIDFRCALADKLDDIGRGHLKKQHLFCLDTGHLYLWLEHHHDRSRAMRNIDEHLPAFARDLKAFHIHANDGTRDHHVTPLSREFLDHPSRHGINSDKFLECSGIIQEWMKLCNKNAKIQGRHVHLEADTVPFTLQQFIDYGKAYLKI
ncbi:MAG: TIM barrel protein [Promethearchaeota archaeon]